MATSPRVPKPLPAPEPAASSLPLRALTLRQLQCFSVLVEEAHFGRAARRLAITQPALSNAIKQVEKLLGAQLLTRSTHREIGRASCRERV